MHSQTTTYVLDGLRPRQVNVAVHIDPGGPAFTVAGLPPGLGASLQALIRSAVAHSGLSFPEGRRISASVSSEAKPGAGAMALPIALAVLVAYGQLRRDTLEGLALAGNLHEDGTIAPVRGALQMAEAVAEDPHLDSFAVASQSASEAACARGVEVLRLYSLGALRYLADEDRERLHPQPLALPSCTDPDGADFADLRALGPVRRAAEIAAAGDHSLLLAAPRGAGQAALARRIGSILPPLRRAEALEVLRIASSVQSASLPTGRPFRAPAPRTGSAPMLGCPSPLSPGEVTLAHNGVLYLEGLTHFDVETLRGVLTARSGGRAFVGSPPQALPSSFFLVASAHPCPCGKLGVGDLSCECEGPALSRHRERLAAAAEQIDLVCTYGPSSEQVRAESPAEPSCAIRSRVLEARARQAARLGEGRRNREMSIRETEGCGLAAAAVEGLNRALPYPDQLGRRLRIARVARTVADLAGAELVDSFHLAEAIDLQLQPLSGEPPERPMNPGNSPGVRPTS